MKEEGIETLKSILVLAVFLGVALTVAAMMPSDDVCCDEFKPLEVNKIKVIGPTVLVIGAQATWELEIKVTNNLEPFVKDVIESEGNNDLEKPVTYYSTRADGECCEKGTGVINQNTITDVIVKDTLPSEFKLIGFSPTQGDVDTQFNENGATSLVWDVGNLMPQSKAILTLEVGITNEVFSKPGSYVINSGATTSGYLPSTQEILTDGPSRSILLTVTDGTPNEAPIAEAGINQMAFNGNPVYLDGSGSYDLDGTIVYYDWYLGEEELGSGRTLMTYLPVGVHTVTLEVEDNRLATGTDEVTVTVYEKNAQVSGAVIEGIVRDATTYRGFDPYIQLTSENYAISTWTDMGGSYRIIGLPEGHYEVYCKAEDYRDFYGQVYIPENGEVEYDIDMIRA